ncbi:hypothetical protein AB1N83_006651 [Pleurotus pulmonarius]
MKVNSMFLIALNVSVALTLAMPVAQFETRVVNDGSSRVGGGITTINGTNAIGGARGGTISGNTTSSGSNGVSSSNGNSVNIGNNGGNIGNSGNSGNGGNVGGTNSGNNGGINSPA